LWESIRSFLLLPPWTALHVEGVAEDEGDLLRGTELSKPVPDEYAFERDNDVLSVRCDGPKKGIRSVLSSPQKGEELFSP